MVSLRIVNSEREEAANVHISVADFCLKQLQSMGKDVILLKDLELRPEHLKDKDMLISLGNFSLNNFFRRRWHLLTSKWVY